MRWGILYDRPVNVSSGEYARYTLTWFAVLVCLVGGVGVGLAALRNDPDASLAPWRDAAPVAVAEISAETSTKATGSVRIAGELVAGETATMPDEPGREVVVGTVRLVAESREGSAARTAELYGWSHRPTVLWIQEGASKVRLDVSADQIPTTETPRFATPERLTDVASSRISKTVGYRYMERDWPLPEAWGAVRSASAELHRSYVPVGARFIAVGQLVQGADGVSFRPDVKGGVPMIERGSLDDMAERAKATQGRLRVAWLPMLLLGAWLLRRVLAKRRDFVERSNRR